MNSTHPGNKDQVYKLALQFADCVKDYFKVHSLYVYGLSAPYKFADDSDLFIAVVADGFSGDLIDDTSVLMKLRRAVDQRIEPHPFSPEQFNENNPVYREIMRTGIRII